jgi:hypothetical protein
MRVIKGIVAIVFLILVLSPGAAAEAPRLPAAPDLRNSLRALESLNADQIAAVAGLVLADRVGINAEAYCPPLRQFQVPERYPCLGAMVSYASAERECEGKTDAQCPKRRIAEAEWAGCLFSNIKGLLGQFGKVGLKGFLLPQAPPIR